MQENGNGKLLETYDFEDFDNEEDKDCDVQEPAQKKVKKSYEASRKFQDT